MICHGKVSEPIRVTRFAIGQWDSWHQLVIADREAELNRVFTGKF